MTSSAACSVAVLVMEPAKMPSVWPILIPKMWPKSERDDEPGNHCDECQEIVFASRRADHALEELSSVEDADPVQEHDQAGQADRPDDLGLRRERTDRQTDEQHGADAKREAADVDLTDEIAKADREEERKDRLGSDDVARKCRSWHRLPL